ncbi:hypothetical protein [Enterobacter sp. UNJFSC 003]|uniref:hypothetical protein n=1 Tax=Enterobacter sp. UNJFSC 003 TaxID=3122077 RepID=UPI002ECD3C7F|nr:hypothetical protein [Serratia liquefaciens]
MNRKSEKVLGINESNRLLRFEYAFRQVGFIVLLGVIVAAIIGLFSSGAISDAVKTNSAKTLSVSYERFGRRETEFPVQITFPVNTPGEYLVSMTTARTDVYDPGSVWPQPDRMYSQGNTLYFIYNNLKSNDKFTVRLFLTPSRAGKWTNTIGVNSEPEIRFWQFIYP